LDSSLTDTANGRTKSSNDISFSELANTVPEATSDVTSSASNSFGDTAHTATDLLRHYAADAVANALNCSTHSFPCAGDGVSDSTASASCDTFEITRGGA
jgi:hypothetical protein